MPGAVGRRLAGVLAPMALLAVVLAGCGRGAPPPQPRYLLGEPYRAGPLWAYPREDFALDQAGIAAVLPRRSGAASLTANGERREDGMFAAHPTLQLPAIVTVTNLENGRSLRVRVNDRGPAQAGRIIAVAPRAAALLGAAGDFQARVAIDAAASRAAIEGLAGQGAALPIAAAPVGEVGREALAPPPGARGVAAAAPRVVRPAVATAMPAASARPPERLPEQVVQGLARPGQLWIEAGTYFGRDFAQREAGRLSLGRVEPLGVAGGPRGRQQQFRVRAGPFRSLAEADAALARAIQSGLTELRLVVE